MDSENEAEPPPSSSELVHSKSDAELAKKFQKILVITLDQNDEICEHSMTHHPDLDVFVPKEHFDHVQNVFEKALVVSKAPSRPSSARVREGRNYSVDENDTVWIDLPDNCLGKSKQFADYIIFDYSRILHALFLHWWHQCGETDVPLSKFLGPVSGLTVESLIDWGVICQVPAGALADFDGYSYQSPSKFKRNKKEDSLISMFSTKHPKVYGNVIQPAAQLFKEELLSQLVQDNFVGYLKNTSRTNLSLLFKLHSDILVMPLEPYLYSADGQKRACQVQTSYVKTMEWLESVPHEIFVFSRSVTQVLPTNYSDDVLVDFNELPDDEMSTNYPENVFKMDTDEDTF